MKIARRSSFSFWAALIVTSPALGVNGCREPERESQDSDLGRFFADEDESRRDQPIPDSAAQLDTGLPSLNAGRPPQDQADGAAASPRQPAALRIDIETAEVSAAEPLPIAIRLTNTGSEQLVLELLGREVVFDLIVVDETGRVIWSRLDDNPQPAIVRFVILEPGDDLELNHLWDRRSTEGEIVPPGTYELSGVIPTSTGPLSAGPIALDADARL